MGGHGRVGGLVRVREVQHLQLTVIRLEFTIRNDSVDERGINRILDGHFVGEAVDCRNRAQFQDVGTGELFRVFRTFNDVIMGTANDGHEITDIVVESASLGHTDLGFTSLELTGLHVEVVGNHVAGISKTAAAERGKDCIAHPGRIVEVTFLGTTGRDSQRHIVVITGPAGREVANGKIAELGGVGHIFYKPGGIVHIETGASHFTSIVNHIGKQECAGMDGRGGSRGATIFPF